MKIEFDVRVDGKPYVAELNLREAASVPPDETTDPDPDPQPEPDPTPGKILLGASGPLTPSGGMDSWVGKPLDISGTWNDNADVAMVQPTIQEGKEHGAWVRAGKPLDLAFGGIWRSKGDTWREAGNGTYAERWTTIFEQIRRQYAGASMKHCYLRFCHEFNLRESDFRVNSSDVQDFKKAWGVLRDIQHEVIPDAKLVFCPNDGTSGDIGLHLTDTYPAVENFDVYGFDTYNNWWWHAYTDDASFQEYLNKSDSTGPVGPEMHRQSAALLGKPVAICEYGSYGNPKGQAGGGDAPGYFNHLFDWIFSHQGDPNNPKAGQIIYCVQFNLWDAYQIHPTSFQPNAAEAWRKRMHDRV